MLYIATSYLPVLRASPVAERARSLVTVLPYYSPWALAGVVIMAVTGPLSATIELNSWEQLFATAYGRTLVIKILLVGALLLTSAIHVLLLRPRLRKEVKKYAYAASRLQAEQATHASSPAALLVGQPHLSEERQKDGPNYPIQVPPPSSQPPPASDRAARALAQQVRLREGRLAKRSGHLPLTFRFAPLFVRAPLVSLC